MTIPPKPEGAKGCPVGGLDQHSADDQKGQNGADFDGHHDVVGFRRFPHAAHQQQGENENDEKAGEIEVGARPVLRRPRPGSPSCPAG